MPSGCPLPFPISLTFWRERKATFDHPQAYLSGYNNEGRSHALRQRAWPCASYERGTDRTDPEGSAWICRPRFLSPMVRKKEQSNDLDILIAVQVHDMFGYWRPLHRITSIAISISRKRSPFDRLVRPQLDCLRNFHHGLPCSSIAVPVGLFAGDFRRYRGD